MGATESKREDRTELVMRMERPVSAPVSPDVEEPRTALFRNPDLILDAAEVETVQMSALLGGALSAHRSLPPPPPPTRAPFRWALWLNRLLVLSVLGTFFLAIAALAMTGVEERARAEAKAEARLLQELLLTGSLSEALTHLNRLEGLLAEAKNQKSQPGLRARVEATLYRLHDADPARRRRALALLALEKNKRSSDGAIAAVLLAPSSERGRLLREAEALALATDASPAALRAAIEAQQDEVDAARSLYEKAETLEPSHVIHLYGLFSLERGASNEKAATMVLERMEDVNPSSAWTRLAEARSEDEATARASALLALASNDALPAVPRAIAAESALRDQRLGLAPEDRSRLETLRGTLLHGDESFLAEIPLPPPKADETPPTIVTPELTIGSEPPEQPTKKIKKKRRKRRAR